MLKPAPGIMRRRGVNAIVLCGGKSSRMGFDKAFIKAGGRTLVERQAEALGGRFGKVILATNSPGKHRVSGRVETVPDGVPGLGPLGGLAAALARSDARYNFAVACDMPFMNADLAVYMAGSVKKGYQAVVPFYKGEYQPLCAVYSRDCLGEMKEALARGRLKLVRLLGRLRVRKVTSRELRKFGDPELCFRNINTPRDLRFLRSLRRLA
ncbi:MAG: molybdenum cofactor guanylyltransferase [Elusimicrobia bacterium]|nr:molybdenum cofactor guanylyltransferase [Elusimicrobiota bacterium]